MKKEAEIIKVIDLDVSFSNEEILFNGVFLKKGEDIEITLKTNKINRDLLELEFEIFGPDFEVQGRPYCVKAIKLMPIHLIMKDNVCISLSSFENSQSAEEIVMAGMAEYLVANGELEISKVGEETEGTEEIVFSFEIGDFITEGREDFNKLKNVFTKIEL